MKRLLAIVGAVALAAALSIPVMARANLPPTLVVANGDGSVTVSTDAVPNGGCVGAVSPTKYACSLRIILADGATLSYSTDGGPTAALPVNCPCTASFWVHAGQWHQYSADSDPFVP